MAITHEELVQEFDKVKQTLKAVGAYEAYGTDSAIDHDFACILGAMLRLTAIVEQLEQVLFGKKNISGIV